MRRANRVRRLGLAREDQPHASGRASGAPLGADDARARRVETLGDSFRRTFVMLELFYRPAPETKST